MGKGFSDSGKYFRGIIKKGTASAGALARIASQFLSITTKITAISYKIKKGML